MPSHVDSGGEGIMFSGCPNAAFVRSSVHSFVRPARSCYHNISCMNGLSSLDKTDREYSLASVDDLVIFWTSKVKVTAGRRGGKGIHVDTIRSLSSSLGLTVVLRTQTDTFTQTHADTHTADQLLYLDH